MGRGQAGAGGRSHCRVPLGVARAGPCGPARIPEPQLA
jgi:hypothetical protein